MIIILTGLILITFFLMGAAIGSFLGVVVYRLPRKESIIFTPSHCTKCNTKIAWYQNIPVVSFIFLRGKCSNCRTEIPIKYFLIEVFCGVLGLFLGILVLTSVVSSVY